MKIITDEKFEKGSLKQNGIALIVCYNNQLGHSPIMEPILEKLKRKFAEYVVFLRIDISKNKFIVKDFLIREIPTYLIFLDGKLVEKIEGMLPFNLFSEILGKYYLHAPVINQLKNKEDLESF